VEGTVTQSRLPLEGIRVIDFTQVEMGPICSQMLGDFGADVVKIERRDVGEIARGKIFEAPGESPPFLSLNRNKRSLALDLKKPEAMRIVWELIDTADVILNNFRPDVMGKLGLGYEEVSKRNPRIIYASGSGWGPTGPYAYKGGQDLLAQALSGMMDLQAPPGGAPAKVNNPIADFTCGMLLVQGILLALVAREKTGRGQTVTASLLDGMIFSQLQEAAQWLNTGMTLNWGHLPMGGPYQTKDGTIGIVGAFRPNPLRDLCGVFEIEDLSSTDPRFGPGESDNFAHAAELEAILAENFKKRTTAEWLERLEAIDFLCTRVLSLKEALDDPQVRHNGMVIEMDHPQGKIRVVGTPIKLGETPASVRYAPPLLGQHNDEILASLGYKGDEIAKLRSDSVIR
jgi:crotonobetainyl-CoA:carnitine CoA-transferase CaiB-like acyl-CoA transferase